MQVFNFQMIKNKASSYLHFTPPKVFKNVKKYEMI